MNRRDFLARGCACGAVALGANTVAVAQTTDTAPTKDTLAIPLNPDQIIAVLNDVERSGESALIDAVFSRWGYQCFHTRSGLKAFAEKQRGNFKGYVDYVNGDRAKYWERIDYDEADGVIKVTSRKFATCNCAYAQCPQPAKALCTHCCTAMQAEFFQAMTGCTATVRVDESILLGGERCCTTVRLHRDPSPIAVAIR